MSSTEAHLDAHEVNVDDVVLRIVDRSDVSDTLYRYCSSVDNRDWSGLRGILADDARVRYGNGDWIIGGDTVVAMLKDATAGLVWTHHFASVYHVEVTGDEATALTYHTSHQVAGTEPDVARVVVGRYFDRLLRTESGWRIATKAMEILWAGDRRDPAGRLHAMGGRGPERIEF